MTINPSRTAAALAVALGLAGLAGCEPQSHLTEDLAALPAPAAPAVATADDEAVTAETLDEDQPAAEEATDVAAAPDDDDDDLPLDPRWSSALENLGFDENGQRPGAGGATDGAGGNTTTIIVVPTPVPSTAAPAGVPVIIGDGTVPGAVGTSVNPGTANDPGVPPTPGTPRNAAMPRYPSRGPSGAIGAPGSVIGVGRSGAGSEAAGTTRTTATGTGTPTTTGQ